MNALSMRFVMMFALCAFIVTPTARAGAAQNWKLDVSRSHATFAVRHIIVETVTGRVPIASGMMTTQAPDGPPAHVDVSLEPRGIDTGIGERDDALRGADYFDVTRYPTWTFTSISFDAGNPMIARGMLSIHGRSQLVVLTIKELEPTGNTRHFVATTIVDRHAFGMVRTNADALIGSEVRVDLDIVFAQIPP